MTGGAATGTVGGPAVQGIGSGDGVSVTGSAPAARAGAEATGTATEAARATTEAAGAAEPGAAPGRTGPAARARPGRRRPHGGHHHLLAGLQPAGDLHLAGRDQAR